MGRYEGSRRVGTRYLGFGAGFIHTYIHTYTQYLYCSGSSGSSRRQGSPTYVLDKQGPMHRRVLMCRMSWQKREAHPRTFHYRR